MASVHSRQAAPQPHISLPQITQYTCLQKRRTLPLGPVRLLGTSSTARYKAQSTFHANRQHVHSQAWQTAFAGRSIVNKRTVLAHSREDLGLAIFDSIHRARPPWRCCRTDRDS
eukprot:6059646-Prymnesium_polylepis.2